MSEVVFPYQRNWGKLKNTLYPFLHTSMMYGAIIAVFLSVILTDLFAGLLVLCLAMIIGLSWRIDMLPVVSFVLTYQWIAITAGYFFHSVYGYYPSLHGHALSSNEMGHLKQALLIEMLGLFGLLAGIRFMMHRFSDSILRVTMSMPVNFSIQKAFWFTVFSFSFLFVFSIAPKEIWFGGAQIIYNLLSLRFIPFFILLLIVFRLGHGYKYAFAGTIIVILPELLTGFSRFKEVLFIVLLAILAQWKPWISTPDQRLRNRKIMITVSIGGVMILLIGLVWSGGLKEDWRNEIWKKDVSGTPIERMVLFFKIADRSLENFDIEQSTESLAGRFSSGTYYFSRVVSIVPDLIPHEEGELFFKAIMNAVIPRFLFPEKAKLGGDSWLVRKYAGLNVSGDESNTSIGLGYMGEFYIDFGVIGVFLLCIFYGVTVGWIIAMFARAAPYNEIFMAMTIGLLFSFLMAVEGSFIKLFAGLLQRGFIVIIVMYWFSATMVTLLGGGRRK